MAKGQGNECSRSWNKEDSKNTGYLKKHGEKISKEPIPTCIPPRAYTSIIDPYVDIIRQMIKKGYIGTRIHEELKASGFTGSLSTVHRLIKEIQEEEIRSSRITTRYETPPGYQMQYDWTEGALYISPEIHKKSYWLPIRMVVLQKNSSIIQDSIFS